MLVKQDYPALSHAELLERVKLRVEELREEYGDHISTEEWSSETQLDVSGSGIDISLQVVEQNVSVEVSLPFMFRPFSGQVQPMVRRLLLDKL